MPQSWIKRIRGLLRDRHKKLQYVVQWDETCWWFFPNGVLTWARRGAESVARDSDCSAKASITAANEKLPLLVLAKGQTKRVATEQLGNLQLHQTGHSPSGSSTVEPMIRHLTWLRKRYPSSIMPRVKKKKIVLIDLILGCYTARRHTKVRRKPSILKINLHYVTSEMTEKSQPLNRRVFGCLMATARNEYCRFSSDRPAEKICTLNAA
jgi:hypothetical protein